MTDLTTNEDLRDDLANYGDHMPVIVVNSTDAEREYHYHLGEVETRSFGGDTYVVINIDSSTRFNPFDTD